MPVLTYTTMSDPMGLTIGTGSGYDVSAETLETIIDLAIDALNLFGADLGNLTGTAGAKSLSCSSAEKGAILIVARAVYYSFYKNVQGASIGGITVTANDLMKDPGTLQLIKDAARALQAGADEEGLTGILVG